MNLRTFVTLIRSIICLSVLYYMEKRIRIIYILDTISKEDIYMDYLARLRQIMNQHHMSEYKLSQASGIPLSTINSLFNKGNTPTIPTLEGLCRGLNISLSDFFYEQSTNKDSESETQFLINNWKLLTKEQKSVILDVIKMLLEA